MSALPRPSRGFTLVEMLVAVALMAMLVSAAAMAIHAAQTSHVYSAEKTQLVARVRGVLDRLARDVRRADSFNVPDDSTLVITMPDGTTRTYQWDGLDGGTISLTVNDGTITTGPLSGFVKSFTVTDADPACQVRLLLAGDQATTEASITTTPRKNIF